jgi:hypothetical protein
MRALYLTVGTLLGVIFTTNTSLFVVDYMTTTFEREISIYTLVGYYEGYQRGQAMSDRLYGWRLTGCINEVNRLGRGNR